MLGSRNVGCLLRLPIEYVLLRPYVSAPCPVGWTTLYDSCYKISSNKSDWNSANSTCEELGSSLIILNSLAKIKEFIKRTNGQTWIGLKRDLRDSSRWQWVDGSTAFYSYWLSGEPNNYGDSGEDCVVMNPHIGKWNDQACSSSHYYVCEINGNTSFYDNKYNQKVK